MPIFCITSTKLGKKGRNYLRGNNTHLLQGTETTKCHLQTKRNLFTKISTVIYYALTSWNLHKKKPQIISNLLVLESLYNPMKLSLKLLVFYSPHFTSSTHIGQCFCTAVVWLIVSQRFTDPKEDLGEKNGWGKNPHPEHQAAFQY